MGSNFSKIKIGTCFTASDGATYKKTSELTYDDMTGIEHYIDPFFDKLLSGKPIPETGINTSARIVKGEGLEIPTPKLKSAKKPAKISKKTAKKK